MQSYVETELVKTVNKKPPNTETLTLYLKVNCKPLEEMPLQYLKNNYKLNIYSLGNKPHFFHEARKRKASACAFSPNPQANPLPPEKKKTFTGLGS